MLIISKIDTNKNVGVNQRVWQYIWRQWTGGILVQSKDGSLNPKNHLSAFSREAARPTELPQYFVSIFAFFSLLMLPPMLDATSLDFGVKVT